MRDGDVRRALYARLEAEHRDEPDTLFVDELSLCGAVRVDVTVVNGSISGYELKSARDTLRRLPAQVETYSLVMDFATLVVATNHHEQARAMLPEWWGLIIASGSETVELAVERRPLPNPNVDQDALVRLLWRDEALAALDARGLSAGVRSKPKQVLWNRLVESVPLDELRRLVRESMKSREGWPAGR